MVNIKDVAREANVSTATVSRVLSNKPNVRDEVRAHVLAVVERLGYRRNRVAANLRRQTSGIIGLLVSDIRNPFFTDIARAIEDVAHDHELSVFLCNTDEDPLKEAQYLETLLAENVAGIILSPTPSTADHFEFVLNNHTPIVMIDRRIDGVVADCVLSDNEAVARMLTQHLIDAGCERIGAVIGMSESTTGRARMAGYRRAVMDAALPAIADFVRPNETAGEALVSKWLASDKPPDAILTGNIRLTIGALNAIRKANLRIPDDLLLAGFDETVWMQHIGPGITVVSQPTYEMGRSAAELLIQRMAQPDRAAREVILKGDLIVRGSTRIL